MLQPLQEAIRAAEEFVSAASKSSPAGHGLLGVKIALAALVFAGGLYYFLYAVRQTSSRPADTVVADLLIGVCGIFTGGIFGFHIAVSSLC